MDFLSTACETAYWVLEVILKGVPSRHQHPSPRTCEKTSSKLEEWLVRPSYPIQNGSKWFEIISSHCYQPEVTISLLQGDLPASLTPQVHCTLRTWVICWASQARLASGHQSHILISNCFTSVAGRYPVTLMQILGVPDRHSIKPSRFSASTPEKEPPNLSLDYTVDITISTSWLHIFFFSWCASLSLKLAKKAHVQMQQKAVRNRILDML